MQPLHNDKREAVISLLNALRTYNPSIGYFEQYLTNENFEYVIKVTNGRIRVSSSLVDDWALNPSFITEFELKHIASGFHIVNENIAPVRAMQTTSDFSSGHTPKTVKNNPGEAVLRNVLIIALIILGAIGIGFFYTKNQNENQARVEEDNRAQIRNNIASYVTAERSEFKYYPIGGISDLKITVTNNTDYSMDKVTVKVNYIKTNGELWESGS